MQNLQDYCDPKMFSKAELWEVADLNQLVRKGRGRTNLVDGSLCTLTTNSGKLYGKARVCQNMVMSVTNSQCTVVLIDHHSIQEAQRCMHPNELMASMQIPTSRVHARSSHSPCLVTDGVSSASLTRMAGNAMSVPCVGVFILLAQLCLVPKK